MFLELPPGTAVREADVARRLGVGRTPVREALQRLAMNYLVELLPGRGAFVTPVSLPDLVSSAGYPSTRDLSSWQSTGTLLLAKCARQPRVSHAGTLADDTGLAPKESVIETLCGLPGSSYSSWRALLLR